MDNKKAIVMCMLVFLLLPMKSVSGLVDVVERDAQTSNVYISSQYKPGISNFRSFSIQEVNPQTKSSAGSGEVVESANNILKLNSGMIDHYNIHLQGKNSSFSGAAGYSSKGLRLELEGAYEEFCIRDSGNPLTVNSNGHRVRYADDFQNFGVTSDRLSLASIMVNTCYDVLVHGSPIVPYICTGIGGDMIRLLNTTYLKFAYQAKLGISYKISGSILLFSDIYYHKVTGKEFKNLYVQYLSDVDNLQSVISAPAGFNIGCFGSEVGIRFTFN
ncbi:MAG: P44/Msp2 family outer membrane protein [Ehrlichia sp.]